jgi:hypothetical protein
LEKIDTKNLINNYQKERVGLHPGATTTSLTKPMPKPCPCPLALPVI